MRTFIQGDRIQVWHVRTTNEGGQDDLRLFTDELAAENFLASWIKREIKDVVEWCYRDKVDAMTYDQLITEAAEADCSYDIDWAYVKLPA
jgi:hypothetical protein